MKDESIDDRVLASARRSSAASLHEAAGKQGALPMHIKPLAASMRVCGPAFTVRCPAGDNLWLHRALYAAKPGDVLVVDVGAGLEHGYWGEIMTIAAKVRSLQGLVIAGGVRDVQTLIGIGFPVFSGTPSIRGTGKDPHGAGAIGVPITIGSVQIDPGDLILGDADGVVAIPKDRAGAAVALAHARDTEEQSIIARLRAGESTISIYNLPQ